MIDVRGILLAFVMLPVAALAQGINAPPTVTSFNQLQGSTGTAITGFGTSIGQALGPLLNIQGSGHPGLYVTDRLFVGIYTPAPTDYTTLQIQRAASYTGGSGQNPTNLHVDTSINSAGAAAAEFNIAASCSSAATAAGSQCVGAFFQGVRSSGGSAPIWAVDSEVIDLNGTASSLSGKQLIGTEIDVRANHLDDATDGSMSWGKGVRVGLDMVLNRYNQADTVATEFAAGYRLGTSSDAYAYIDTAFTTTASQFYSIFDTRQAQAPTGSPNPVFSLIMAAGQLIEFAGNNAAAPTPARTLSYTGSTLAYQVAGITKWSVSDTGAVNAISFQQGGTTGLLVIPGATRNTASGNTAYGAGSGSDNTVYGYGTGSALGAANNNTAVGSNALAVDATGGANTAVGSGALQAATGGSLTAIGYHALNAATTGANSTAVGYQALAASTGTDQRNTAIGYNAMAALNGGNWNVAVGDSALVAYTGGGSGNNVVIGSNSGSKLTTGSYNLILGGAVASTTLTTGSRNILIGTTNNCDTAAGTNDSFAICASTGAVPFLSGSLVSTGGTGRLGGNGGDMYVGSSTALIATSVAGYFHFPKQSAAPTATPTATDVACAWNTTSHALNCYDGSAWYHLTGVSGAG